MSTGTTRRRLEVMPVEECLRLLASRDLGRLAISVRGQPQIFPVNYAVHNDGRIVFRTAPGTKLDYGPRTRVAFEIDDYDARSGVGWSVMAQGMLHDVTEAIDRTSEALRRLAVVPRAPGEREHWLAVYPTVITGRRFALGPGAR